MLGKTPTASSERSGIRWNVAGVSVQGASHIVRRQPCQDAHIWRELPGGVLALAVADGAGSAALSQVGSARAAVAAVEWVTELMKDNQPGDEEEWHGLLIAALQTAHDSVMASAKRRKVSPRELATTLIVLVATPELTAVIQVGDGAALVMTDEHELVALTIPQRGEFVNETTFFTSPGYLDAAQFSLRRGPVAGVAALSDGLQMLALKMPDSQPHPAFFRPLFSLLDQADDMADAEDHLRAFMLSDRITQRADDDLTLVLAKLHH
ncbi:MAG: PP2C family serine/threonine-protein phosphatase [Armatimonadota bacterium]